MITLAPGLMEVMLSAIAPKLPKIFSLLNSVNEEFSAVGINQDGRLLGYFFTDSIARDEGTPDSLRLLMDGYDDVIGDVELGAGSPFEAAVWAGPDAGPIKYGAGAYSNFEMSFAWTVSPDGLMTFTNTYDAARTGLWSGKDGQFFVAEMNYEINTDPYFASDDIGRYGLVSGTCVLNLMQVFNTLLSQSGGNPYSAIEIYAGAMPEDQDALFVDDLGVSPIIFASVSPQFSAISSGETAELRLIEPATGVIPDDAPAGMWARIRGLDGLPAMAMPVYTRGQVEHYLEAGGGLVIAVDAVYPGDYVTLASLQFVQPIGELGKPVTAGFVAPVFSATETDSAANVLVLKRGPAAASVSATTSDATAIAGIHYTEFDGSAEWAEFQAGVEALEIGLVPTEIAELSWSTAPDLLVLFPNSGEGDENFGVDDFGNSRITMAWGSGDLRVASYITPHFVEGSPDRPFQINYKINNRGSRLRFGIGAGDTDHSYALTSVEIRGGAAYPWNGTTPADIDYEPTLVRILAKIEIVMTVDGPKSAVCVKVGINSGWFTPISGVIKEDADDVDWFVLVTETSDTDFFLCVSGETTEGQPNIEVLNWQGGDKPLYFTVHLHDPNPAGLLDGADVIDTAKVVIFQNRLKDRVTDAEPADSVKFIEGVSTNGTISDNGYTFTAAGGSIETYASAGYYLASNVPNQFSYLELSVVLGSLCSASYQIYPNSYGFSLARDGNIYNTLNGPFWLVRNDWNWSLASGGGPQDAPFSFDLGDEIRLGIAVDTQNNLAKFCIAKSGEAFWVQYSPAEDFQATGPATFHADIDDVDWHEFPPDGDGWFAATAYFFGTDSGEENSTSDVIKVIPFADDQLYRPSGFSGIYEGSAP